MSVGTVIESGRPTTIYSPAFTTGDIVRTPASCNGCTPNMMKVKFNPDTGALNYFTTAQMSMFFMSGRIPRPLNALRERDALADWTRLLNW